MDRVSGEVHGPARTRIRCYCTLLPLLNMLRRNCYMLQDGIHLKNFET